MSIVLNHPSVGANGGPSRIIVAEHDAHASAELCQHLEIHGFEAEAVIDGVGLERALERRRSDLIVLDAMLPGEGGLQICRRLGVRGVGIILLSSTADVADRIVGLELGADDYMTKSSDPRELIARIRAILRTRRRPPASSAKGYHFRGWSLSAERRRLSAPTGELISLSSRQFMLLHYFLDRPQRVLTRVELMLAMKSGAGDLGDRSVDVQVSRLRKKLGDQGGEMISSMRGDGYVFKATVARF